MASLDTETDTPHPHKSQSNNAQPIGWHALRWTIATLLATTATLKAILLATHYIDTPTREAAVIAWEYALAVLLIINGVPRTAWAMCLVTFVSFTAYNVWSFANGMTECDCLGPLSIPPIAMITLDTLVLAALLWFRPQTRAYSPTTHSKRLLMTTAGIALAIGGAISLRIVHGDSAPPIAASPTQTAETVSNHAQSNIEPDEVIQTPQLPTMITCDFGYVEPGQTATTTFTLTNTTDRNLVIRSAKSNCNCIQTTDPRRVIHPKETSHFAVALDAPKEIGQYRKQIYLRTDSSERDSIRIEVVADIGLPLDVEPKTLTCSVDTDIDPQSHSVQVTNRGKQPVRMLYSTATHAELFAKLPHTPLAPGQSVDILIFSPPSLNNEASSATLTIHTTSKQQPTVRIPIAFTTELDLAGDDSTSY